MAQSTREFWLEFFPLSISVDRMQRIEHSLQEFASVPLELPFNPQGTDLFSIMELRQSYARRAIELCEVVKTLLQADKVIPAAIAGRALIETIAAGSLYMSDMRKQICRGDHVKLIERFERYFGGTCIAGGTVKPIHVMDAIRHLDEVDSNYVTYLDGKFGLFSGIIDLIHAKNPDKQKPTPAGVLSVAANYDKLSEVAHPNGLGVHYLYPDPSNETEEVQKVRQTYRRAAASSVWQCHHLLKALEETVDLPQKFAESFPDLLGKSDNSLDKA